MSVAEEATSRKTWRVYQSNIVPKLYNKTKLKQVSAKRSMRWIHWQKDDFEDYFWKSGDPCRR